MRWIGVSAVFVLVVGCQDYDRQTENYGDVASGPGGTILINEEHQGGWGRGECLLCHNAAFNVHRNSNSIIDPEALNIEVWKNGGSKFCLNCHGINGVQQ